MMKKLGLLLTTLLLILGVSYTAGTGKAAAATAPSYSEISTFVDGKLIISASKSLLYNSSAYVPVKLLDQIPGLSVSAASSGITVSGAKGTATLNKDNSVLYKNSNYVAFKTLLKIGAIDGKYASSALSLFIWSHEEGKAKSNSMLTSISKLPGTMGIIIGKKVYVYGYPGTQWVTDVQYNGGTTESFTMLKDDGTTWTLEEDVNDTASRMYSVDYLQYLNEVYRGLTVWIRNSVIEDSPFKNVEKVTIKNVHADPVNGDIEVTVRRASGEEITFNTEKSDDPEAYIDKNFYFKNPRSIAKISDKMWTAIREERVVVGMTITEVYLAWGDEDRIDNDLQLLVYGNKYLYFFDGKLNYIHEL